VDNLPDWVMSIIAIAVGLSLGLALLSARRIAWLLDAVPRARPEVAGRSGREPTHGEPTGVAARRG
jgi:hypothetical protein